MIGWKPTSPDARVASVRIRCLNPLRELKRRGFPIELFRPERMSAYETVIYSKLYDAASQREAAALKARGTRIVVDLCDNHFYNPRAAPQLVRARADLQEMLALADHLVVSTAQLADIVRDEVGESRSITIIGDAVEESILGVPESAPRAWLSRRKLRKLLDWLESGRANGAKASLVWFGIHGGPLHDHGMGDLVRIRGVLEALHRKHPIQLTAISNSRTKFEQLISSWSLPTRYLEWSPATFLPALCAHHIAVIPVTSNPFTLCKSSNRLATALSCGLAVVADPIPSYQAFAGVCRLNEWEESLEEYVTDPAGRSRDVARGQALVAQHYTLDRITDDWERFLTTLRAKPISAARLETSAG